MVALKRQEYGRARVLLTESLALGNWPSGVIATLDAPGWMATAQGQPSRAARLIDAVEAITEGMPDIYILNAMRLILRHSDSEGDKFTRDAVCAWLGSDAFAATLAEGRAMSLEQAVAYTLETMSY